MELTNLAMASSTKRKHSKKFISITTFGLNIRCIARFTMLSLFLGIIAASQGFLYATKTTKAEATTTTKTWTTSTNPDNMSINKNQILTINMTNGNPHQESYANETEGLNFYNFHGKVNPFWLQFEPVSPFYYYGFGVLYILLFIIGCGGNLLVIFMFYKQPKLLTPATTLVLNLAISDFIMLVKCPLAVYNNFKMGPATGDIGCRIYGFLGGLSGTTSILTLTAIAIDRYCVVVHPLNPLRQDTNLRPILMIVFIWIYSFTFSIIPALDIGLSTYVPEGLLTTCSFDYLDQSLNARIFMFTFFVCAYLIPLIIILYCYVNILLVVCNSKRLQASQNRIKTEQKLTYVIIFVIGIWFGAWTPYSFVAMLGVFGQKDMLSPLLSMGPAIFCKISACIDPYIYAATQPRFRTEFRLFLNRSLGDSRRLSFVGSSFRTRSTVAANRKRSSSNLALESNAQQVSQRRPSKLGAIIEDAEESYQEASIEIQNECSKF